MRQFLLTLALAIILIVPVSRVTAQTSFPGVQSGGSSTAPSASGTTTPDIKFVPEVPIPGQFEGEQTVNENLAANYVKAVYVYFIWIVGVLATVMIIYGGIKWVAAAGNPSRINDARETINNAIIGVIIGLTSVLLLNIINPQLVKIGLPRVTQVEGDRFAGSAIMDICAHATETACGTVVETGKIKINKSTGQPDPNGEEVPKYCIGTKCGAGGGIGSSFEQFCQIDRDATTNFYKPGSGCVREVTLETPPPGDFANFSRAGTSLAQQCGTISKSPDASDPEPNIGIGQCPGDPAISLDKPSWCYQIGAKAQIAGNRVKNVQCPAS